VLNLGGARKTGKLISPRQIVTVEVVILLAAAIALSRTGHQHQIAAVLCAVVGLHFLPLARLFRAPVLNATAFAMCVVAIATFALAPARPALWTALPGIGAAAILYATCAVRLLTGPGNARGTADQRADPTPAVP
jgi:cell division protein FtsW (lipid II flippase)